MKQGAQLEQDLTSEEMLAYFRECGAKGPANQARYNRTLTLLAVAGAIGGGFAAIAAVRESSTLSAGAAVLAAFAIVILHRGVRPKASPRLEIGDMDIADQIGAAQAEFLEGVRERESQAKALRWGGTILAVSVGALLLDLLR